MQHSLVMLAVQEPLQKADQEMNAFMRYWHSIKWEDIFSTLIAKTVTLIFLFLLFFIVKKVGKHFIYQSFQKYKKRQNFSESRINTLYTLSMNVFYYTLFFILLYSFLSIIGIPVGSLLAGAGIAGLAIGLGAQGFINDLITGFFMILERQIEVGDYVKIDAIEGTILAVGLRTTQIKSADGVIHFLPNRTISIISNFSRSNMRVQIDVRLNPQEQVEKMKEILETVNKELTPNYPEIQSGPDILGVVDLGNGNYAYRVIMYTLNGKQYQIQRDFLAAYVEALQKAGIQLPTSPINLTA